MRSCLIVGIAGVIAAVVINRCPSVDKIMAYFNKFRHAIGHKSNLIYQLAYSRLMRVDMYWLVLALFGATIDFTIIKGLTK